MAVKARVLRSFHAPPFWCCVTGAPKGRINIRDLTFWFQGPISGGMPEIMVGRILVYVVLFGPIGGVTSSTKTSMP